MALTQLLDLPTGVLLSSIWGPMLRWTPAGMINAPVALGADVEVDLLWPAVTTALLAAGLVWAAVRGGR